MSRELYKLQRRALKLSIEYFDEYISYSTDNGLAVPGEADSIFYRMVELYDSLYKTKLTFHLTDLETKTVMEKKVKNMSEALILKYAFLNENPNLIITIEEEDKQ